MCREIDLYAQKRIRMSGWVWLDWIVVTHHWLNDWGLNPKIAMKNEIPINKNNAAAPKSRLQIKILPKKSDSLGKVSEKVSIIFSMASNTKTIITIHLINSNNITFYL